MWFGCVFWVGGFGGVEFGVAESLLFVVVSGWLCRLGALYVLGLGLMGFIFGGVVVGVLCFVWFVGLVVTFGVTCYVMIT